jgi:YVTN family beta-propeller protein
MNRFIFFSLLLAVSALFGSTQHMYVTNSVSGEVRVIDTSNNTVQSIFGFTLPRVVKITSDGTRAFVGCGDDTIRLIDTLTHIVLPTSISINNPTALDITPDNNFLYVVSASDNNLVVISTATNTIVATITGFDNPQDVKITPNGAFAYVSNKSNGTVSVIDTSTNTIVHTITGFNTPLGLTLTIDGSHAYVTDTNHNALYVIDIATNTISGIVLGFNLPAYVAMTPDKTSAYITNTGNDTVSILRLSDNTIVGFLNVPAPRALSFTQDGTLLYVGSHLETVFAINVLSEQIVIAIPGFAQPSNITSTFDNAPAITLNACQMVISPTHVNNVVTWVQPVGSIAPTSYKLYYDAQLTKHIATVSGATFEYTDLNLEVGQTYSYYLVAVYASGFSSSFGSVTVAPVRRCFTP